MIDLLQGHIHEIVITANETIKVRVLLSVVVVSFKAIRWEQQLRWILCNHLFPGFKTRQQKLKQCYIHLKNKAWRFF